MPLSLKKAPRVSSSLETNADANQTKERKCPWSRKQIRTAVAIHCGSLKYLSNMQNPKNKYRSDLNGKWQKDPSEVITQQDRSYSKMKCKALIQKFKAHGKKMREARQQKPSYSRNVSRGNEAPAILKKPPHDRTRAERIKTSKEINKLIKSKLPIWQYNRPLMKGKNEKGETITTQIIHLVEQWTAEMPTHRPKQNGVVIQKKKRRI